METQISSEATCKPKSSVSFSDKRTAKRNLAKIADGNSQSHTFYKSLQTVPVKNNLSKLHSLRAATKSISLHNRIDSLSCVLEDLTCQPPINDRNIHPAIGILDYQVGLDIYADYLGASLHVRNDDLSTRFRDDLLDPDHGLRCIIYRSQKATKRYIILDSDELDIVGILRKITSDFADEETFSHHMLGNIDHGYINTAIKTLDTEHDRSVIKCILAKLLGRRDMIAVGIDPHNAVKKLEKSNDVFQEISNAKVAAEDMIELRLKSKLDKYQDRLQEIDRKIDSKVLTAMREGDLHAKKEVVEEQISATEKLLNKETCYDKQKHRNCVKRLADKLIDENRIKSRSLGAGAKPLLDSEDELFIANAIENKSSAHGRRQNTVLYLHHRVKLEDLLSIANYNLIKRGKRLIRSAKTVHLRSRPRKINTIEGRKHKGTHVCNYGFKVLIKFNKNIFKYFFIKMKGAHVYYKHNSETVK